MSPDAALAALDNALASVGENVTLQRAGQSDLPCRGAQIVVLRDFLPQDLAGNTVQADGHWVLSPTEGANASWPLPPRKNDKLKRGTKIYNVETVVVFNMNGAPVRYELQVKG